MSAAGVSERQPNLAEVRELITATTAALKGISRVAYQAPNGRVGDVAAELGGVGAFANAGLVTMTAEAEQRGEVQESQSACTAGWLRDSVWHLRTGGSGTVAKCAATLRRRDLGVVADAVRAADLTPAVAVTVAAEFDKLAPELAGGAEDAVLGAMIDMGAEHGSGSIRRLRESLLAGCGRDGALQDEQDARRRYVSLSAAREESGIFNYGLTLDAEGRAVLEAAIGPLSAPQPGPDGEHDPRPVVRRRGEALIEVWGPKTRLLPTTSGQQRRLIAMPPECVNRRRRLNRPPVLTGLSVLTGRSAQPAAAGTCSSPPSPARRSDPTPPIVGQDTDELLPLTGRSTARTRKGVDAAGSGRSPARA